MDPIKHEVASVYRAGIVGLLGLLGAGLVIALTTAPAATKPVEAVGILVGLFLAFVGIAGVVDTFWR